MLCFFAVVKIESSTMKHTQNDILSLLKQHCEKIESMRDGR